MKGEGAVLKRKLLTTISIIFLLLGSALIIVPQVSNEVGKQQARSEVEEFDNLKKEINKTANKKPQTNTKSSTEGNTKEEKAASSNSYQPIKTITYKNSKGETVTYKIDIDKLYRDSLTYNENLKKNQYDLLIDKNSYKRAALDLKKYGVPNNVYGYITAPTIGMELPIYLGANDYSMSVGAAHMTYTSLPLGGKNTNCVLAAHTGYIGRIFFDYIRDLNVGDDVKVTNFWNKLNYKVIKKHIYKNYESSDCYISEGKDLLTLITCAYGGSERYYVICERS